MRGMNTVLPRLRVRDGGVGQANFRLHSWFVVQSLRCVQHFATPWTAARQPSLSFTISQSLPKLMSVESVMLSNHLHLLLPASPPALNPSLNQGLFQ